MLLEELAKGESLKTPSGGAGWAWAQGFTHAKQYLQRMLWGGESAAEASHDEESLKERIGSIRDAWAEGDVSGCFRQLGNVIANLTAACEERNPQEHVVFQYYTPPLPKKTCNESVDDIFVRGSALVEAMQVSMDDLASLKLNEGTVAMVHALYFLRAWLIPLARTHSPAMLWAGFWDADPRNRTTLQTLHEFATATDHATVHPDSWLGQVIDSSDDLVDCYKEDTRHLLTNMWAITSMSFVLGMMERRQSTVVALVNKDMKGERALQKAVLYEHEIPTLGVAAYGLGYWSPQVLLIDMQGTCSQTSPALQRQLLSRLGAWVKAKQEQHWRLQDFVRRSRLHWRCLDCANAETCNLDSALAQQVTQLVEEKQLKSQKGQELQLAVEHPGMNQAQADAEAANEEERDVLKRLEMSLLKMQQLREAQQVYQYYTLFGKGLMYNSTDQGRDLQDLVQKADVNTADRSGQTVLHAAASKGYSEMVALLLEHRAEVNEPARGCSTPLHRAALQGHLKVSRLLIEHKAFVNSRNERLQTPLHLAAGSQKPGRSQVLALLLDQKAEVNSRDVNGDTPLHNSAHRSIFNPAMVGLLLAHRAEVSPRNVHGDTPLTYAVSPTRDLLLQHGATP
eukprot:s4063_g2.t1